MPVFVEDPSQFSKSKLKSDLVAHSVALPAESKKQVYVELHLKHIDHKSAADFSSDEEDLLATDDVTEETKHLGELGDSEMLDPSGLTDDELRAALLKCGVNIGPITATTRALYERRLIKVLQADVQPQRQPSLNGSADTALYSDSEEEEEVEDVQNGEEAENGEEANAQEEDSIAEQVVQEPDSSLNQSENPAESRSQNTGSVFHGCFSHSSRLRFSIPAAHREGRAKRNAGNVVESSSQRIQTPLSQNVVESSQRIQTPLSQIASGFSRAASVNRPSAIEPGVPSWSRDSGPSPGSLCVSPQSFSIAEMVMEKESSFHSLPSPSPVLYRATPHGVRGCNQRNVQLPEEPMAVDEPVTELSADTATDSYSSPPGIIVTRRKPIKGAAGRPVVYKYPVTPALAPVSPTTAERRELERRLVPIWVRMLVFVVVACLLILIYTYVNDNNNPLVSLLDSLSQGSEEQQPLTSSEDMPVTDPISGQE